MRLGVILAVFTVALGAGCGGSDDLAADDATPTSSAMPSPVELENPANAAAAVAVTQRYVDALINRRPAALCALQSPAFVRSQVARAVELKIVEQGATCVDLVTTMLSNAEKASATAVAEYVVTATEADNRQVRVRIDYPTSATAKPDAYQLVRIGDSWLIDKPLPDPLP